MRSGSSLDFFLFKRNRRGRRSRHAFVQLQEFRVFLCGMLCPYRTALIGVKGLFKATMMQRSYDFLWI
jgi:hypothetical protein